MSYSTILRAVRRRWYITVPGVLLALIIACTVFTSMTPRYTSSGIAVLVRQNNPAPANLVNPVMGGDGNLTTATSTLVQALDTPAVKAGLGLREGVDNSLWEGVDNFTVSNVGKTAIAAGADHPFLYITTQSSTPQKSTEIVTDIIDIARQRLAELQNDFHVRPQNQIKLESVVDATPPQAVMDRLYAVAAAVLMLGILATCIVACAWDGIIITQQKRQILRSTSRAKENADRESAQVTRIG